jgi:hypothetical protein
VNAEITGEFHHIDGGQSRHISELMSQTITGPPGPAHP